ncbi:hypothetical protein J4G43_005025 [Bradyrhizobium barranii subsp. barranii]|uniref:Uncharacterized protein n=1 Tax=Bradyrhizobium barranii subsp. barranii TaxID=2823807 RepID=A0A939M0I2_9BRAD|nr:hypothetical protein [Bradyrhizobium barranii]UEM13686.1 hypothetical protein J4G43_005025 [Bradyrhizobium barranii subsp. barranii]
MTRPEKYAGYVAVPRWLLDDDRLAREPFTEVQAFVDMIARAAWRPQRVRLARGFVDLQRGQLLVSVRFLAKRWQWSEQAVRRFLDRISGWHANGTQTTTQNGPQNGPQDGPLIGTQTTRDGTIVTIHNYDVFQKKTSSEGSGDGAQVDAQNEAQLGTQDGTPSDQKPAQSIIINNNNNSQLSEESCTSRASPPSNVIELPRQKSEQAKTPTAAELTTVVGALFGECRKFQVSAGVSDRNARSVVGKWRREHADDEIFEAVKRAQSEEAQDPVAFISGCLKRKPAAAMVGVESALAALEALR